LKKYNFPFYIDNQIFIDLPFVYLSLSYQIIKNLSMKKFFTKLPLMVAFILSVTAMNAQTIVWPSDSASKSISQFVNAAAIRVVKKDTALNASLANYKGWLTMGLASKDPAKVDSTVFMWTADGTAKIGSYWGAADARITSADTSRGFGAAMFCSDFLDSRGVAVGGSGQSPSPHTSELWSPVFDATGFNDLTLMFQQTNRHFQSAATIDCFQSGAVSWSEDGGTTWKPLQCIEENEGYGLYDRLPRNTPTAIKLVGSKGTSKFRIKFHFDGDYYYWLLDDIRVGVLKNNVTLSKSWVSVPQAIMQRNNVDSTRFMVDVVNNGTVAAKNVKLTVDVLNNATLATVFTATRNYGTLAPDSTAGNEVLTQAFLAPNTVGTYDIRYKISYDSTDMFQRDDSIYFAAGLRVRDSLFSNEQPGGFLLGYAPNVSSATRAWKLGQYYYLPKGSTSTATRISAYIQVAASITTARTYGAGLYEWNDLNNNDSVEVNERKLIAYGETVVPATNTAGPLDVRLENFLGNTPVFLKDKQAYLAMLEITPNVVNTSWFGYFDDRARMSYGPMEYATKKVGKPRHAGVIDINSSDANSVWRTNVFGGDQYAPRVSLWAWPIRIDTKDDLPSTYKINVYPNPVGQNLNVNIDFPKSEEAVLFRIFDLKGQLIQEKEFMNVQKETINMDVNKLANGSYLLQVQTIGNQAKTLKFVKAN
jgi:Secretion system C-terminal sorting domain